uniref:NADH-ubiquinone oxidoreductase chain 1 n=1 Tax=Encarsia obtusiclava TaxID=2358487 RepID=A0A386T9M4_9HYME|nr:NADH dehydrogenase subunit 1 [Encarsia obtusiclava]
MFLNMNIYLILISLEMMVLILLSIAFLTLFERKLLGYIQIRKGCNKVGFIGLFQPFSDALKLFSKETMILLKSNYLFYLFSPMFMMMLMLFLWNNIPLISKLINYSNNLLVILCLMSLGVYGLMLAGWSSNSFYSLIGSMRSIAQTISYEVSMIFIMMNVLLMIESFNMMKFLVYQNYIMFFFMLFPLSLMFFVSLLAEMNRTPFDFAEGESELVSGFNTEYMSGSFAMIFLAEYGMIMFMMFVFMFFFMKGDIFNLLFYIFYIFMLFLVIWVRGTYPRFRYDNLMYMTWKLYLPVSMFLLMMILGLKMLLI